MRITVENLICGAIVALSYLGILAALIISG